MWLRLLRGKDYPALCGWAWCNHCGSTGKREEEEGASKKVLDNRDWVTCLEDGVGVLKPGNTSIEAENARKSTKSSQSLQKETGLPIPLAQWNECQPSNFQTENRSVLFETTKFIVTCYSTNRKLIFAPSHMLVSWLSWPPHPSLSPSQPLVQRLNQVFPASSTFPAAQRWDAHHPLQHGVIVAHG